MGRKARSSVLPFIFGVAFTFWAQAQEMVTGPVKIYDTVYERVDPGPPFTEAPRTKEDWQPPEPTRKEQKAGFIVFTRAEPFDIKPWSVPRREERATKLSASVALGETTSLWFAVYALEPLNRLSVAASLHPSSSTSPDKAPIVEVRYAHFWAQRTDWRGRTYYIVPELLLPMKEGMAQFPAKGGALEWRSFDIPKGECRLFWLTVRVPTKGVAPRSDAFSGDYPFLVRLRSKGKEEFQLNLTVHVSPFRLQKPPDKRWLLYSDIGPWGRLPDEKVLAILQDIAEHGIDGLTEMPFGSLNLSELQKGKVSYDPSELLRLHRLMKQAGLKGPHTIGAYVEEEAARVLGISADLNKEWDERLKDAVRLISRTVVETLKPHDIDWLFYGWDEPGPEDFRAIQQYRYWREGGAKTYVTFFRQGTYEVAGQWMTNPCFSVGLVNSKEAAEWAKEQCQKRGQKFFWYGSGCYLGQEGRMFPNRYLTGWLFWKTQADGQVSWTFVRPHEDPFNDFDGIHANRVEPKDQCIVYPYLEHPDDRNGMGGIIPTIQWEAIREGINDYCYLYTLCNAIAYARKVTEGKNSGWAKRVKQVADETGRILEALTEGVPWGNEVGKVGYGNKDLQKARIVVANALERLVVALKGWRMTDYRRCSGYRLQ